MRVRERGPHPPRQMVLTDTPFNEQFAPAQLHWILADKNECIVIEPMADGLHIYDNPGGCPDKQSAVPAAAVLPQQLHEPVPEAAAEYIFCRSAAYNLQPRHGCPRTSGRPLLSLPVCTGRFYKIKCPLRRIRTRSVSQFFHILGSVDQQRGCCEVSDGKYEITLYTSCCNADKGIYYYTTYENHQITAVDMNRENLDGETLSRFPLVQREQIRWEN